MKGINLSWLRFFVLAAICFAPANISAQVHIIPKVGITAVHAQTSEPIPYALIFPGTFRVSIAPAAVSQPITVHLSYSGTAGPEDYDPLPRTVVIPAGATSTEILVRARSDSLVEGTETVIARIEPSVGAEILTPNLPDLYVVDPNAASAEVRIADEDQRPQSQVVSIEPYRDNTIEPSPVSRVAPGVVKVRRTGNLEAKLSVPLEISGTAQIREDYEGFPPVAYFEPRKSEVYIVIRPLDDPHPEPVETVIIALAPPPPNASYSIDPAKMRETVRIADNDRPESAFLTITEPASGILLPFGTSVNIKALAVDPSGYIPRVEFLDHGQLIGVSEVAFLVPPEPGTPIEHEFEWRKPAPGLHSVAARALLSSGVQITSAPVSISVITNMEPQIPVVSVHAVPDWIPAPGPLPRPETTLQSFEFRRTGPTSDQLLVRFRVDGTATEGTDYEPLLRSIVFQEGHSTATMHVNVIDDQVPEGPESVRVRVIEPLMGVDSPYPYFYWVDEEHRDAVIIIQDNDQPSNAATLRITQPTNGMTFPSEVPIVISAVAVDPNGYIPRVTFFADGLLIGVSEIFFIRPPDPGTPIVHTITWTNAPEGRHWLTAQADDSQGNLIVSDPVSITVGTPQIDPPDVRILEPEDGAVYREGAPVFVNLLVQDLLSLDSVWLSSGFSNLWSWHNLSSNAHLTFVWSNAPAGIHTLKATAVNAAGLAGTSAPVRILIQGVDTNSFVLRDLPPFYTSGTPFNVRLHARPLSTMDAYAVEEKPPTGWVVTEVSHDGVYDSRIGKVKFGPFTDRLERTLTYRVRPPARTIGSHTFTGLASADGISTEIGGDRTIAPSTPYHPADRDTNSRIVLNELTAYAAVWRSGAGGTSIPASYVTRAGLIWKMGESYRYMPEQGPAPLLWVPLNPIQQIALKSLSAAGALRTITGTITAAGEEFEVTIDARPSDSANTYAVEESIPSGWTAREISSGGELDVTGTAVRWGPFLDNEARTLSYSLVRLPVSAAADSLAKLRGLLSADGQDMPIKTAGAIEAGAPRLSQCEFAADGSLRLKLAGPAGEVCVLESSSDLVHWKAERELFLPEGELEHVENTSPEGTNQRYYRLRVH